MKRYEEQLKNMLIYLAEGFGIGLIGGFILSWINYKEICGDFFGMGLVLGILIGGAASMILMSAKGVKNAAANSALGIIRNMFGGLFTAGVGSGLLLFIFLLKMMLYIIIALILFLFMMISFPLTIIYTVVMYFVEKRGKDIDADTADKLDKIVPIIAFVITALILYILFKGGDGTNKVVERDYDVSVSTQTEQTEEGKIEKNNSKDEMDLPDNAEGNSVIKNEESPQTVVDDVSDGADEGERYIPITEKSAANQDESLCIDGYYRSMRYVGDMEDDLLSARIEDGKLYLEASVVLDPVDSSINADEYWGPYHKFEFEVADDLVIVPYIISSKDYETLLDGKGIMPSTIEEFNNRFNGREEDGEIEFDVKDGVVHEIIVMIMEDYVK